MNPVGSSLQQILREGLYLESGPLRTKHDARLNMKAEKLITRKQLSKIQNYEQFLELRQTITDFDRSKVFDLLFEISLRYEIDNASEIAAMLLIGFDPRSTRLLEELLAEIADSSWYLSDKYIPFYLVTQFGKHHVINQIDSLLASSNITNDQKVRIEGIKYWAEMPAAYLSSGYTYFEWQDAIEGNKI